MNQRGATRAGPLRFKAAVLIAGGATARLLSARARHVPQPLYPSFNYSFTRKFGHEKRRPARGNSGGERRRRNLTAKRRVWLLPALVLLLGLASTAAAEPKLLNLSARARIGPGAEAICGFVVRGHGNKQVLVRAGGPSLAAFDLTGFLPNPTIDVRTSGNLSLGYNDDWSAADTSLMRSLGAYDFPADSKDAALLATFPEGEYTPVISDLHHDSGVGIIELYDSTPEIGSLVNLSTRALVGVGNDQLIVGFSIRGNGLLKVLVRAVGPGLSNWLPAETLLANPTLEIRAGDGRWVAASDDGDFESPEMVSAQSRSGAFPLPKSSKDAALVVDLPAGEYTVQIRGFGDSTGLALAEVYAISGSDDVPEVPVSGIFLEPPTLRLSVNQSGKLRANVLPFTATNRGVTWSTDDSSIARVSGSGEVVGISPGTTLVTAQTVQGDHQAPAAVTVTANSSAATVDLFFNQPMYVAREGIGANVTAISQSIAVDVFGGKLGSAYCRLPEATDEAAWQRIFETMTWSGLDWIRLLIELNDFEPQRGVFTWDSPNFLRAKKILSWAQAHRVHVLLQLQGHASRWNTLPGQDPAYSAPADLDAFADGFATMVDTLVHEQGLDCITMVNIANEPMNPWGWWRGGDIRDGYRKTRAALDARGITIPLAGTEYFANNQFNANWEACKPYLGVYENHNYADASQNTLAFRPITDPAYPVLWGEFGGADNTNYPWLITTAKWQLGGFSNGVDGFARWSYLNQNDIDGDFSYVRTWDTAKKQLLDTYTLTPNLFHLQAMLTRFSARGSQVHTVATDNPAAVPALLHSPGGAWTAYLVNVASPQPLDTLIQFHGLQTPLLLHEYQLTATNASQQNLLQEPVASLEVKSETPWVAVRLPPDSITVLTTYQLRSTDEGVVSDGPASVLPSAPEISSHKSVFDDLDSQLAFSSGWSSASDVRDHGGTSHYTRQKGATCTFSFTGTRFRLFAHQDNGSGLATVTVDGRFAGYASFYAALRLDQRVAFDSGPLAAGSHVVEVRNEGKRALTSLDSYINIDAVGIEAP